MNSSNLLPHYRYSTLAASICLCTAWSQPVQAACTLIPTAGNDNYVCDSASSGALTDLLGNNSLTFPANGTGVVDGGVTFGGGNDTVTMNSGTVNGALAQGDGADRFTINAGQIAGAVTQGNGVDDFVMNGGVIQSLAQGDSRDTFEMNGGTITGAFEDGDSARMTAGTIGRVDMKLDNNLFDLSGGEIFGNLVSGFGTDTIIISGGRIGGNVSVSGGNDSITLTGGEIAGEIRASAGDDTFVWGNGGTVLSAILLEAGNDSATLRNLNETALAPTPSINGGTGIDVLTFDGTSSAGAQRYVNWETVNLNNGSSFDLDGVFRMGDNISGTGVFNMDGSSTLTSAQGSISAFSAGQLATLNNAGLIDLSTGNNRTNDTLTVQGNYVGDNGRLFLQTVLGDDSSPSDKLVVADGTLTGRTAITVTNLGGLGALTQQNGIQVVEAQGTAVSDSSAFALAAPISAGAFDYNLYKGGVTPGSENSFYLRSAVVAAPLVAVPNPDPALPPILVPLVQAPVPAPALPAVPSGTPTLPAAVAAPPVLPAAVPGAAPIPTYRPEVPTWSVMPPAAAQMALTALGTFHDRQGDQRLLTETGALSAGWGRVYGENFEQTWAGTVTPTLDGSLNGYQVGHDLFASQISNTLNQRGGVFVADTRLRGDVDGFNQGFEGKRAGKIDIEGKSAGLYWTLLNPLGGYLDLVAMHTWLDGDSRSERGLEIDNDGHVTTFSAEVGQPFAVTDNWLIEPQAQVIYQKVSLDTQNDGISRVTFDSDAATTGRLGMRLEGSYEVSQSKVTPYVQANIWHTMSGTDSVTFDDTTQIDTEQKSTQADLGFGAVLSLTESVSVYAGIDYGLNIDSNQQRATSASAGLRMSW